MNIPTLTLPIPNACRNADTDASSKSTIATLRVKSGTLQLLHLIDYFRVHVPASCATLGPLVQFHPPPALSSMIVHSCNFSHPYIPKISKTCMGYRRRLVPNFKPIGKIPAEKTATEQKNSKFSIPPVLCME